MGTEVLRAQDCIRESPVIYTHRKNYGPKVNRKPVRPENRRKSPEPKKPATDNDSRSRSPKIVLGQVTILRRGESLDTKVEASEKKKISEEIAVYGTGRLGPDPKMIPKGVSFGSADTYAGSAFFTSPAPSSLPLPSFFKKDCGVKAVDDAVATRDLRRLLRLD